MQIKSVPLTLTFTDMHTHTNTHTCTHTYTHTYMRMHAHTHTHKGHTESAEHVLSHEHRGRHVRHSLPPSSLYPSLVPPSRHTPLHTPHTHSILYTHTLYFDTLTDLVMRPSHTYWLRTWWQQHRPPSLPPPPPPPPAPASPLPSQTPLVSMQFLADKPMASTLLLSPCGGKDEGGREGRTEGGKEGGEADLLGTVLGAMREMLFTWVDSLWVNHWIHVCIQVEYLFLLNWPSK